jgi:hypothetical protein
LPNWQFFWLCFGNEHHIGNLSSFLSIKSLPLPCGLLEKRRGPLLDIPEQLLVKLLRLPDAEAAKVVRHPALARPDQVQPKIGEGSQISFGKQKLWLAKLTA